MEVKKIYFDMDGVLANFDKGVIELGHGTPLKQENTTPMADEALWNAVRSVDHFFDKLELMDKAKELFDLVYDKYGDRCEILTAIPKPKKNIANSKEDKISWVRRVLSKDIVINVVYKEEKKNYCHGESYILIDDYKKNIEEWKSFGGTGILHKDAKSTIQELKELNIL